MIQFFFKISIVYLLYPAVVNPSVNVPKSSAYYTKDYPLLTYTFYKSHKNLQNYRKCFHYEMLQKALM